MTPEQADANSQATGSLLSLQFGKLTDSNSQIEADTSKSDLPQHHSIRRWKVNGQWIQKAKNVVPLTFINRSDSQQPDSVEAAKGSRKAIRSHVMRDYLYKKERSENKNLTAKQDSTNTSITMFVEGGSSASRTDNNHLNENLGLEASSLPITDLSQRRLNYGICKKNNTPLFQLCSSCFYFI
jgi:hypothetical protein